MEHRGKSYRRELKTRYRSGPLYLHMNRLDFFGREVEQGSQPWQELGFDLLDQAVPEQQLEHGPVGVMPHDGRGRTSTLDLNAFPYSLGIAPGTEQNLSAREPENLPHIHQDRIRVGRCLDTNMIAEGFESLNHLITRNGCAGRRRSGCHGLESRIEYTGSLINLQDGSSQRRRREGDCDELLTLSEPVGRFRIHPNDRLGTREGKPFRLTGTFDGAHDPHENDANIE